MDVTLLMASAAVTIGIVWTILGCVMCKKQSIDEAAHQKYFEKFRKRHMLHADRVLPSKAQLNPDINANRILSLTTTVGDHTYEDIPSQNPVKTSDGAESREHSFFDESFQTVVEASSTSTCNGASIRGDQCLSVPSNKGSYLSLPPESSRVCFYTTSTVGLVDKSQDNCHGNINTAFSTISLDKETADGENMSPHNDTYLVPTHGPKIKITQHSIRRSSNEHISSHPTHSVNSPTRRTHVFNYDDKTVKAGDCANMLESKLQSDEIRYKNLKKLLMEGPSHYSEIRNSEGRRQSYDSAQTLYEQLKRHRLEDNSYKSLTSLVLPSRSCKSSSSARTDHTYESITAELSSEMLRGDLNDSSTRLNMPASPSSGSTDTPQGYSNYISVDSQNDLNTTPDHTYESVTSRRLFSSTASGTPDLSVVIIGKRPNGVYDSFRNGNNFSDDEHKILNNLDQRQLSCDSADRYSPFPNSKKLALKSYFRPMTSPRNPAIETISGRLTPYRIPKCLDDLGQPSRRFSIENIEAHTPEITVNDKPKMFNSPQKQYFNPRTPRNSTDRKDNFISPLCTYETLKHCTNMKSKYQEKAKPLRLSNLPSISDRLAEEIGTHCNMNENTSSTPVFVI